MEFGFRRRRVRPSVPGTRRCLKCNWFFVSPDPIRLGRCQDCRGAEDQYSPRALNEAPTFGASRSYHTPRDTS